MFTLLIQCTTLITCRIGDLELSNLQPKKAFIIAALDKEIRLSFAKRIRSTLPQEMNELIPARLDEDNSPEFKYDNPGMPFDTLYS
jgi:nuclear cap-binding protein subunit 1